MTVDEKIRTIDNKIKQKKAPQDFIKISALSSGIVGKYDFLSGKDVSLEKYLSEKNAKIKRF